MIINTSCTFRNQTTSGNAFLINDQFERGDHINHKHSENSFSSKKLYLECLIYYNIIYSLQGYSTPKIWTLFPILVYSSYNTLKMCYSTELREGAKNILRGGCLKSVAFGRKMLPPPPLFSAVIYTPPIFSGPYPTPN